MENHLSEDEGKAFLDIAVNAGWEKVIKDAPTPARSCAT